MRLGQLSRKVEIKPSEILAYLKKEFNVELGSHLNTKVDDALAEKVIAKFHTSKPTPIPVEPKVVEVTEEEIIPEVVSPSADEEASSTSVDEKAEDSENVTSEEKEPILEFAREIEIDSETISNAPLIKTEKIVLEGPKVVGKIELPEPPPPQMVEVDGVMYSKEDLAKQKREKRKARSEKTNKRRSRTSEGARSSRIKSEAQLEQLRLDKEAKLLADKIAHREKRIEAKRKEAKKPVKKHTPKKTKKSNTKVKQAPVQEAAPAPPENLSVLGKIWKWFNT